MRHQFGAFAFLFMSLALAAPAAAGDPARLLPMQFVLRHEGPAVACRDQCRTWISATGMIKPDSVRDFETFAAQHDIRGATIALDSEGGSVLGALALGRAIRRFDMTTTVGKTTDIPGGKGDDVRAILSPRADCESMCAFVLLAGSKRIVPPDARVRVHQIWLGDRREDANAATYSAEDMVLVQRDIGKLAQYTIEMGGAAELLEVSLRIPPWEPMRALTRDELRRMRLDTADAGASPPSAATPPLKASAVSPAASNARATSVALTNSSPAADNMRRVAVSSERGWTMVDSAGAPVIARRHPLTVEGENIGSFDVVFSCGNAPGDVAIFYSETRRRKNSDDVPGTLRDVTVSVGQNSAVLAVDWSEAAERGERRSTASGVVAADVVKAFGDAGSHSLTIQTSSADDAATTIRVGNSGVAQYLAPFAAACAKQQQPVTHAGLVQQQN